MVCEVDSQLVARQGMEAKAQTLWETSSRSHLNLDSLVTSLFEMSPGVRRWSGAEEATGCRLLASPPYLLRSGQA